MNQIDGKLKLPIFCVKEVLHFNVEFRAKKVDK